MRFYFTWIFAIAVLAWPLFSRGISEEHQRILVRLEKKADFRSMDSLYSRLSAVGQLDEYEYIQWGRIKGLIRDYKGAAEAFGFAAAQKPGIARIVRSQFVQTLNGAEKQECGQAIAGFVSVSLAGHGADTAEIFLWASGTYGKLGLFKEEVNSILESGAKTKDKSIRLLHTAGYRFTRRLFAEAVIPAQKAWGLLETSREKNECAAILYNSYVETGLSDSAIVWFERAVFTDMQSICRAVVLYQAAGLFVRADSLISTLAPSLTRDTLMLRQLIFKGKTSQAFIMAGSAMSTAYWAGAARDAGLWKVRLAVFKNDLAGALAQIDSAKIDPNWQYAAQMLEHKYACNLFAAQPELFGAWSMLSLSLYSGHPEYAADTIASLGLTGSIRELVLATLCEALLDAGMQEKCAAILLPAIQESPDARILFIYAEACAMQGKYDEAGKILNKLILEYPDDIFSDRARMYLSGFNDKIKMHE